MQLTKRAQVLMRMALGEFREIGEAYSAGPSQLIEDIPHPVPSRQYHNRITVWRDRRSDSTRVMRQLSAKGWAREQESTEKQITYGITPSGVRALVEQMEA